MNVLQAVYRCLLLYMPKKRTKKKRPSLKWPKGYGKDSLYWT